MLKSTVPLGSAELGHTHFLIVIRREVHLIPECASSWVLSLVAVIVRESTLVLISTLDFSFLSLMECYPLVSNPLSLSAHALSLFKNVSEEHSVERALGILVRRADSNPSSSTNYLTSENHFTSVSL